MLSVSEDLEDEEDDIDLHDRDPEDSILLEDNPGMEKKADIGLEEEEDEVSTKEGGEIRGTVDR